MDRLNQTEPCNLANEYMGWFATECHYTPAEVFAMAWPQLINLTLLADDVNERRRAATNHQTMQQVPPQRMY